jgi:hypothetical protein
MLITFVGFPSGTKNLQKIVATSHLGFTLESCEERF